MLEYIERQAVQDFRVARRRARLNTVRSRFLRVPHTILPFPEVRRRIILRGQRDLGFQTVPLSHIIGSEGRSHDFDRSFMPLSDVTARRWQRISGAYYQDITLGPVDLYKLGGIYFVRDGNHRVSVARSRGQVDIDAHVVEILTNVALTPDLDGPMLVRKEAQSEFLMWSDLLRLRPGAVVPVEASEPSTYRALMAHIEGHRYFLGIDHGREVPRDEAMTHWYDRLYLPQVAAIRRTGVRDARGGSETRLYLRIMEHRYYMSQHLGHDPGPDAAVNDYVRSGGGGGAYRMTRLLRAIRQTRKWYFAWFSRISQSGGTVLERFLHPLTALLRRHRR
jgi:hypothetical protein